jgi:hypothetical protein
MTDKTTSVGDPGFRIKRNGPRAGGTEAARQNSRGRGACSGRVSLALDTAKHRRI